MTEYGVLKEVLMHIVLVLPILWNQPAARMKDFSLFKVSLALLLVVRTLFLFYLSIFPWTEIWWATLWFVFEIGVIYFEFRKMGWFHFKKRMKEGKEMYSTVLSVMVEMVGEFNDSYTEE